MNADIGIALTGALVGLILAIVGGGGSIIAVPLLLYGVGMPSVHAAIGTSAVAVALSALGNLFAAMQKKMVKWPCALLFTAAGLAGTFAGSRLALSVDGGKLLSLFGGLMLVIGTVMLLRKDVEGDPDVRLTLKTARHMAPWLAGAGLAVGFLAGFFGIGGGFLIVPALMFATGMTITSAIATSLVAITAFGAMTASSYALAGEVVWRDVAVFVGGGVAGSVAGQFAARFVHRRRTLLQSIFAGFVMAIGVYTLHRGLA
jgi:uncharacterized protein